MTVVRSRYYGVSEIELSCDTCGRLHGDTFPDDEFARMIRAATTAGWRTKRVGGDFEHECDECQADQAEAARSTLFGTVYDDDIEELL